MQYRILPAEEYDRLAGVGPFATHPVPPPKASVVAVAERDGALVGYWCAATTVHAEPVWIGNGSPLTAVGLMKTLFDELGRQGIPGVYIFAPNDTVANLLQRAGFTERNGWRVFEGAI